MHLETYLKELGGYDVKPETKFDFDYLEATIIQNDLDEFVKRTSSQEDWVAKLINPLLMDRLTSHPSAGFDFLSFVHGAINACSGSYYVSGYKSKDGKYIDGYVRNCWKHK